MKARQTDEMIPECLKMREAGFSTTEIARQVGRPHPYVSVVTNRVAAADVAHDPEARDAYPWWRMPRCTPPKSTAGVR